MPSSRSFVKWLLTLLAAWTSLSTTTLQAETSLDWRRLPDLPEELGVAGPFAGVHEDALIIGGGANFPRPVWESNKQWVDSLYVLVRDEDEYQWKDGGKLPRPIAYGACVSTKRGVLCLGGCDAEKVYADAYFLTWDGAEVKTTPCPSLPQPMAFGQAALIGQTVYVACGQTETGLASATNRLWSLDLAASEDPAKLEWKTLAPLPGPTRSLCQVAAQHDGFRDSIYVIGGRREENDETQFLSDVWQYIPQTNSWKQRRSAPRVVMAGEAIGIGQSHIYVLGSADESNFYRVDELKNDHPGFPRDVLVYHTITDTWVKAKKSPESLVTTTAVKWGDSIVLPSGEVRPRVRSPHVWLVTPSSSAKDFGVLNYVVLFSYLLGMVGVGIYFSKRNKSTDDFFRGGKKIPWWAAGCSIFATMLSSLTFLGFPSKAFAQDWVYAVGNFTIPIVAILAAYVAMPFYRRIDATSAYQYLELRFGKLARLLASSCFVLFHLFRMAIVMSLTALALAVATPLTPIQSVLLMGVLSIAYSTMGGIEAVIWTDTIQTFVLLGGALLAVALLVSDVDGGMKGFWQVTSDSQKFNLANLHWDITAPQVALWVVLTGAIAQNISSYTADQAVVQRYVTTPSVDEAKRSIWISALLTIPATLIFFTIGTSLFAYYESHPGKLDAMTTTDQIFPLFIAREIPVGLAGLIVAGIFAAAQSTVSTSMNSSATAIIVDLLRPLKICTTERSYLTAARWCTFTVGTIGTVLGIWFVDNSILSLFDQFIVVIGIFMGILGGLFLLGAFTRKTNQFGALVGALVGVVVLLWLRSYSQMNSYFYPAAGLSICFVTGYAASLLAGGTPANLTGLTIYDLSDERIPAAENT